MAMAIAALVAPLSMASAGPLPTIRDRQLLVDGKLYFIGGRTGNGSTTPKWDVVEMYDPATKVWSR